MEIKTLKDFLERHPDTLNGYHVAIVELEKTKLIGLIEDMNETLSSEGKLRIRFPLEFIEKPIFEAPDKGQSAPVRLTKLQMYFLKPELGIPDEFLTDMGVDITVYTLKSKIGLYYRGALDQFEKTAVEVEPGVYLKTLLQWQQNHQASGNQQQKQTQK